MYGFSRVCWFPSNEKIQWTKNSFNWMRRRRWQWWRQAGDSNGGSLIFWMLYLASNSYFVTIFHIQSTCFCTLREDFLFRQFIIRSYALWTLSLAHHNNNSSQCIWVYYFLVVIFVVVRRVFFRIIFLLSLRRMFPFDSKVNIKCIRIGEKQWTNTSRNMSK